MLEIFRDVKDENAVHTELNSDFQWFFMMFFQILQKISKISKFQKFQKFQKIPKNSKFPKFPKFPKLSKIFKIFKISKNFENHENYEKFAVFTCHQKFGGLEVIFLLQRTCLWVHQKTSKIRVTVYCIMTHLFFDDFFNNLNKNGNFFTKFYHRLSKLK